MDTGQDQAGCLVACRAALLSVVLALGGCATYSDSFSGIERNLSAQQYDKALQLVEKQADTKKDRALYFLNKGMVLRMKRDFAGSNQALEAGKVEMERLFAASVSENTLSYLLNDATVSYAGEDYEQVLVHLYMALNYLELGQYNEARVEALQVDIKLREIGEKDPEGRFTEDAFSRYITGLVYEDLEEWGDALIAYRKSYEAYKKYQKDYKVAVPDMLKHDLLRLAQRLGQTGEAKKFSREFGIVPSGMDGGKKDDEGELVFILNNGLAPIKREKVIGASAYRPHGVLEAGSMHEHGSPGLPVVVHIALPHFESRSSRVLKARVSVSGKQAYTQMMEDIDAIARASLESRLPAITARSVARAVAKVAIQKSVDRAGRKRDNDLAIELLSSFAVRVAAAATERADTRSWLTLPANIQLARLAIPAGQYTVHVELLGEGDQVIATREFPDIVSGRSRKTYLTQHWVSDLHQTSRR